MLTGVSRVSAKKKNHAFLNADFVYNLKTDIVETI